MKLCLRQSIFSTGLFFLLTQSLFPQFASKNNYTGAWEAPTTWDPTWAVPLTSITDFDITINGFVTSSSSLSFSGSVTNLIINDTLVVEGNLTLGNNNNIKINDDGVLIIRGDLTIDNQSVIQADGYLIITRDIIKKSSINQGSFRSNDNPVKVFIGGTISKVGITDHPEFPVLNSVNPPTIPYSSTGCAYGDMTDFVTDPIYSFFETTCAVTKASSNSPLCTGGKIELTSSGGTQFSWGGPNGFTSFEQNPVIKNSNPLNSGIYNVIISDFGCDPVTETIEVIVKSMPVVTITSSSQTCVNDQMTLTGTPAGGTFTIIEGPGSISGNVLLAIGPGNIILEYKYSDVCTNSSVQTIIVNERPLADAGPDQKLEFLFETKMDAHQPITGTGEWTLIAGSGKIKEIHSPVSAVTDLSVGVNKFLWTVNNGPCVTTDEIIITVKDLFIPSVITPNGDSKNDNFKINALIGRVELLIFNRWGNEEYSNNNYLNNWDGRNNQGEELPEDTYFYVVKFGNGLIRKGSVLLTR